MRSAVLIGGYAAIAETTRLPLALREISASAGLNLLWDRFHYALGAQAWGDAPARCTSRPTGAASHPRCLRASPWPSGAVNDLRPIALSDPAAVLRLRSYVWPTGAARAARLQGAIALAQRDLPCVDGGDAAAWVERELATPRAGAATVLLHPSSGNTCRARRASASKRPWPPPLSSATQAARHPAAHGVLRQDAPAELRLTLWPRPRTHPRAQFHPHGEWVEWL